MTAPPLLEYPRTAPLTPCNPDSPHLFSVGCVPCTARWMSKRTLEEVTNYWERGIISRDALDGYRHVWAISAVRSKTYDHWKSCPDTDLGKAYAKELTAILPSGRGYC